MQIGVITALDREARVFARRARRFLGAHDLVVKVSGPGCDQAARAAEELLKAGCDVLLSWGLAGGLNPDIVPAQLIVGSATNLDTGEAFVTDEVLQIEILNELSKLAAVSGPLFTSPHPVATANEKSNLHVTHAADAVDMESAAIARAAQLGHAKFAAIRCIVDPAGFDLPAAAALAMGTDGRLRLGRMLGHLLRHPGEILAVLKLAAWYRAALDKLDQTAHVLVR